MTNRIRDYEQPNGWEATQAYHAGFRWGRRKEYANLTKYRTDAYAKGFMHAAVLLTAIVAAIAFWEAG